MAITPVPSMSDTPPFPALADRAAGTYNAKAYAFGAYMADTFNAELLAVADNIKTNAADAEASALSAEAQVTLATAQANAAAVSAAASGAASGVVIWVSGATYAVGDCRFSPTDFQTYRRKTAGAGITDPIADAVNWALLLTARAWITKTSAYTAVAGDRIKADTLTSGAFNITFPETPMEGDQIEILDVKSNFDVSNLSLIGNGKTIMGYTTIGLNIKYLHRVFTYDAILGDWRI